MKTADRPDSRITAQKPLSPEIHSSRLARHSAAGVPDLCHTWGLTGECMGSDTATGTCPQRHYFVSEHERCSTHESNEAAAATVEGRVLAAITKRENLLTELRGTSLK